MKTTLKSFSLIISTALLAGLSGCTKNLNYQRTRLQTIKAASATASVTHKNVSLHVKHFGTADNKHYFNQATLTTQPIQIAVENNSESAWILSPTRISLPLVSNQRVINNLQSSIGWSVFMGLFIPVIGIVHGIFSYNANKVIQEDVRAKMLEQDTVISPGQQSDFIIFADKRIYSRHFTADIVNAQDPKDKLAFTIDL